MRTIAVIHNAKAHGTQGKFTPMLIGALRSMGVRCVVITRRADLHEWRGAPPDGIVLSGSPATVTAPVCMRDFAVNSAACFLWPRAPVLGICFGMQALAVLRGGEVRTRPQGYRVGVVRVHRTAPGAAAMSLAAGYALHMHHGDYVHRVPPGFAPVAYDASGQLLAMCSTHGVPVWGVQHHPEADSNDTILRAFVHLCSAQQSSSVPVRMPAAVSRHLSPRTRWRRRLWRRQGGASCRSGSLVATGGAAGSGCAH